MRKTKQEQIKTVPRDRRTNDCQLRVLVDLEEAQLRVLVDEKKQAS